jgi:hypothetical protein
MTGDDQTSLSLTQVLLGIQGEMSRGFQAVTEQLSTKASRQDVDDLAQEVREGLAEHASRIESLEDERQNRTSAEEAKDELRAERSDAYRWKVATAVTAVAAFGSGGYFLVYLFGHH